MGDGRQLAAVLLTDVNRCNHGGEFGAGWHIKPFVDLAQSDCRREGAEGLAHLNHRVDAGAHLWMTGIGQNTPVAKSSRPEFHPSAIPTADATLRTQPTCLDPGTPPVRILRTSAPP